MNLDIAKKVIYETFPEAKILKVSETEDLYLFMINTGLENEELFDPFFLVDKKTGKLSDYSILSGILDKKTINNMKELI